MTSHQFNNIKISHFQYKISKPERESESESEEEDDAFGPSTARKDNVNWTDVTDVARESVIFLCFMIMYLKRFWHRVK